MNNNNYFKRAWQYFVRTAIYLFLALGTYSLLQAQESTESAAINKAEGDVVELSPFQVTAGSNVGYGAESTTSASRVAQNYIDVPQTVNVVTDEFISDYSLISKDQLFQYVPNVNITQGSTLEIRGAPVSTSYIDGVATGYGFVGLPLPFYDRVEVVKGPSSAAFGIGEPGGIVNYVTKAANGTTQQQIEVGIGEYSTSEAQVDIQGVAATHPNLWYRVVGFWRDGTGPIAETERNGGAGAQMALRYNLNNTTSFQSTISYARDNSPYQSDQAGWFLNPQGLLFLARLGLPQMPRPVGADVQLTPSGWGNTISTNSFRMSLLMDKSLFDKKVHFRDTIVVSNQLGDGKYSSIANIFNPAPDLYQTGLDLYKSTSSLNSFTENFDLDATLVFNGIKFTTLAGIDFRHETGSNYTDFRLGLTADGSPYLINLYAPDLSIPLAPVTDMPVNILSNGQSSDQQYGAYVQEKVSFLKDILTLTGSGRKDVFSASSYDLTTNTGSSTGNVYPGISTRYAITIKPVKWLSIYYLNTNHKDPVNLVPEYSLSVGNPSQSVREQYGNFAIMLDNQPFGKDQEIGVKANLLDNKITISAAVFKETVGGATLNSTIVTNTYQIVQQYLVTDELKGYEINIFGQPTEHLTLVAGIGVTNGAAVAAVGMSTSAKPPTTESFHIKYDFGRPGGNGFYILLGAINYGDYWLNQDPFNKNLDIYFNKDQYSVDAGLGYRWKVGHTTNDIALTGNNITDQVILVGYQGNGYVTEPRRQVMLTYSIHL